VFKVGITVQSLEKKLQESEEEIARLRQAKFLSESVARLPEACLTDLNGETVKEARGSALHSALMDLRKEDKGRSDLIN
jgi:hypothetical protein